MSQGLPGKLQLDPQWTEAQFRASVSGAEPGTDPAGLTQGAVPDPGCLFHVTLLSQEYHPHPPLQGVMLLALWVPCCPPQGTLAVVFYLLLCQSQD